MGLFDRLRGKSPLEGKESEAYRLHMQGLADPVWSKRDYASFAREAYQKNVVAYRAVKSIADAVGDIKWTAWKGEAEFTTHPILDLIENPNPMQGGGEFWRAKVGYFLIAGNSYVERVMVGGKPQELWCMRPDRMKVIPGTTGLPSGYRYEVGGRKFDWEADPVTGESDIRHYKTFHPTDDWYGLSPVEAGAYSIDQHNEAMGWMQSLLQNSARPSGALVTKDDRDLSDEQFHRLKRELEENYQGSRNAGRPMLLEGGLDWKAMGFSPADMAILESKYSAARDVALAFGVPPQLLGIPGDNTYANYKEARLAFWEDTVLPLVGYLASEFNAWMAEPFGEVEIRPDLEQIPAIAEKRAEMWSMIDTSMELTLDEARAAKGYPPVGGEAGKMLMAELRKTTKPQDETPEQKAMRIAYGR